MMDIRCLFRDRGRRFQMYVQHDRKRAGDPGRYRGWERSQAGNGSPRDRENAWPASTHCSTSAEFACPKLLPPPIASGTLELWNFGICAHLPIAVASGRTPSPGGRASQRNGPKPSGVMRPPGPESDREPQIPIRTSRKFRERGAGELSAYRRTCRFLGPHAERTGRVRLGSIG